MCMTRHTFSRRESQIEEAICSSRIFARKKDRTQGNVEVITLRFRLIFNPRGDVRDGLNVSNHCSNRLNALNPGKALFIFPFIAVPLIVVVLIVRSLYG